MSSDVIDNISLFFYMFIGGYDNKKSVSFDKFIPGVVVGIYITYELLIISHNFLVT